MDQNVNATEALSALNRRLVEAVLKPLSDGGGPDVAEVFKSLTAGLAQDTGRWFEIQNRYYQKQIQLWASVSAPAAEAAPTPVIAPDPADRRFRAREWQEPYFKYLLQSYLLRARWLSEIVDNARLETHAKKKLVFFARQMIDAMSPANFPWSNPEALKLAAETRGESLAQGLKNLAADLDKGLVSMTDERAFEVGRNLAITPGAVVFENDFFQLLQYRPATNNVYRRPLLMVPPCINKYYILDLQPENSFVRFAVGQGHTVFMVSWKNPTAADRELGMDDYLRKGVYTALDAVLAVVPKRDIHAVGYCIGGTLLAIATAALARKNDKRIRDVTIFAGQTDFKEPGELSLYISPAQIGMLEALMQKEGVLESRQMGAAFAMLRAHDLLWQPAVKSYLKGEREDMIDLMAWNADGTRMPWKMHTEYLVGLYLNNDLAEGRFKVEGKTVKLSDIHVPMFVVGTETDHVAPWKSVYKVDGLVGSSEFTFLLTSGGHNAGIVSGPVHPRRRHRVRTRRAGDPVLSADQWFETTKSQPGSWWPTWAAWLQSRSSAKRVAPPAMGAPKAGYAPICPAPGEYVRQR